MTRDPTSTCEDFTLEDAPHIPRARPVAPLPVDVHDGTQEATADGAYEDSLESLEDEDQGDAQRSFLHDQYLRMAQHRDDVHRRQVARWAEENAPAPARLKIYELLRTAWLEEEERLKRRCATGSLSSKQRDLLRSEAKRGYMAVGHEIINEMLWRERQGCTPAELERCYQYAVQTLSSLLIWSDSIVGGGGLHEAKEEPRRHSAAATLHIDNTDSRPTVLPRANKKREAFRSHLDPLTAPLVFVSSMTGSSATVGTTPKYKKSPTLHVNTPTTLHAAQQCGFEKMLRIREDKQRRVEQANQALLRAQWRWSQTDVTGSTPEESTSSEDSFEDLSAALQEHRRDHDTPLW